MREAPRIRRTSSESSFLQSLASIHLETRSKRHFMSNNIVGEKGGVDSVTNQNGTARPVYVPLIGATASDVAQPMLVNISQDVQKDRPLTLPYAKERNAMQGILRFQDMDKKEDLANSSRRRVSFSHRIEGTANSGMSNINLNSPPSSPSKDSHDASCIDVQSTINSSIPASPKVLLASSIKSSFKIPSPQPPRIISSCNKKHRDMSSIFRSSQKIPLPFETNPTSRLSRPIRRYSMIEMDQIRRRENGSRAASPTGVLPASISCQLRRSVGDNLDNSYQQTFQKEHCRFRKDYTLGETARSVSHMIIESCPQKAHERASQLENFDFAFIKRMDGSWTYAILAHRSFVKGGVDSSKEGCMLFVMNKEGSTKMIKKRHWAEFVRCVVNEECVGPE
ncbi:hypothetical protein ACHAWX_001914 [Stephanocyclus meneghinianus]